MDLIGKLLMEANSTNQTCEDDLLLQEPLLVLHLDKIRDVTNSYTILIKSLTNFDGPMTALAHNLDKVDFKMEYFSAAAAHADNQYVILPRCYLSPE